MRLIRYNTIVGRRTCLLLCDNKRWHRAIAQAAYRSRLTMGEAVRVGRDCSTYFVVYFV